MIRPRLAVPILVLALSGCRSESEKLAESRPRLAAKGGEPP